MLEAIKNAILYGKDFCEDTAENIRETVVNAVDCAKLHYRIVANRKELNALYAQLGKNLLSGAGKENGANEEEINRICARINAKEEILTGLTDQYRIVCGKVICPDCGKFMSEKYTYCPYCGKKVSDAEAEISSDVTESDLDFVREIDEM